MGPGFSPMRNCATRCPPRSEASRRHVGQNKSERRKICHRVSHPWSSSSALRTRNSSGASQRKVFVGDDPSSSSPMQFDASRRRVGWRPGRGERWERFDDNTKQQQKKKRFLADLLLLTVSNWRKWTSGHSGVFLNASPPQAFGHVKIPLRCQDRLIRKEPLVETVQCCARSSPLLGL